MDKIKVRTVVSDELSPYLNLAVEDFLLECAERDEIILFLWRNDKTVVVGKHQNPYAECDVNALAADGGCVARRKTGGGAVYHDKGNLNFSFIAGNDVYDVKRQFAVIAKAVARFDVQAEVSGRNDIVVKGGAAETANGRKDDEDKKQKSIAGRKFSGNAFLNGKNASLHHGTVLIKTDGTAVVKYLTPAKSKLEKRGVKSVKSRIVNLCELCENITVEKLSEELKKVFLQEYASDSAVADVADAASAAVDYDELKNQPEVRALEKKFSSKEWLFGKWEKDGHLGDSPEVLNAAYDWGLLSLTAERENPSKSAEGEPLDGESGKGKIKNVKIASDTVHWKAIDAVENVVKNIIRKVGHFARKSLLAVDKSKILQDLNSDEIEVLDDVFEFLETLF